MSPSGQIGRCLGCSTEALITISIIMNNNLKAAVNCDKQNSFEGVKTETWWPSIGGTLPFFSEFLIPIPAADLQSLVLHGPLNISK